MRRQDHKDDDEDDYSYWPPPPASATGHYPVGAESRSSSSSSSSSASTEAMAGIVRFTSRDRHETKSQEWKKEKHDKHKKDRSGFTPDSRYGRETCAYERDSDDDIYETLNVRPKSPPPRHKHCRSPDQGFDKAKLADVLLELYASNPPQFTRARYHILFIFYHIFLKQYLIII